MIGHVWSLARRVTGRAIMSPVIVCLLWTVLHLAFGTTFIYHDSWSHLFPFIYGAIKHTSCGTWPLWLGTIDNGSQLVISLTSSSLTQIVFLPLYFFLGCFRPSVVFAMYAYKLEIYAAYLIFALSTYVLGRLIFRHPISALYLLVVVLFAGLCLDSAHSSQVVHIIFWYPWLIIFAVLALRERDNAARYVNAFSVTFCAQLLDQYPHFVTLTLIAAAVMMFPFWRSVLSRDLARGAMRVWPAVLVLLLTTFHLLVIRSAVSDYLPSFRTDVTVKPNEFSETGFLQPTAFIGTFLPLSFLGSFDVISEGMGRLLQRTINASNERWFIFKLDALLLITGLLPLLFATAFLFSRADPRLRWGLGGLVAFLVAVSLQQTGLYYGLFHLPFFNLFRSYFLFTVIAVFGLLLISACGVDYVLGCDAAERRRLIRIASRVIIGLGFLAAIALFGLFMMGPKTARLMSYTIALLAADLLCLWIAVRALAGLASTSNVDHAGRIVLMWAIGLQTAVTVGGYTLVGISGAQVYRNFGLASEDLVRPEERKLNASKSWRKECQLFTECYLSTQHTVSLRRDLEGSFLRHRDEPVFYLDALDRNVVLALSGLSRPPVWASASAEQALSKDRAIAILARNASHIEAFLDRQVLLLPAEGQAIPDAPSFVAAGLTMQSVNWQTGRVEVGYTAQSPSYMTFAIIQDGHWQAKVNGVPSVAYKANIGGLAVHVPKGDGSVVLEYRNHLTTFVVVSRIILVLLAGLIAARISVRVLSRRFSAEYP